MKKLLTKSILVTAMSATVFAASEAGAATTVYNVEQIYNQVVYDTTNPSWDTYFTGTFSFDDASKTVSNLTGALSQAMSGNTTSRTLNYQLSSVYDATLGGVLVSTFYQDSTDVFAGGSFATGGKSTFGNENAYATIFVNTTNPLASLTQAQMDKLAYADCTPGGLMMGTTCMTGWVSDVNGVLGPGGTMKGTFPVMQTISAVPEPDTYTMLLAGIGVLAASVRRFRRDAS